MQAIRAVTVVVMFAVPTASVAGGCGRAVGGITDHTCLEFRDFDRSPPIFEQFMQPEPIIPQLSTPIPADEVARRYTQPIEPTFQPTDVLTGGVSSGMRTVIREGTEATIRGVGTSVLRGAATNAASQGGKAAVQNVISGGDDNHIFQEAKR
jgi:hypothetical protein